MEFINIITIIVVLVVIYLVFFGDMIEGYSQAAILQLVAKGPQDLYLTADAEKYLWYYDNPYNYYYHSYGNMYGRPYGRTYGRTYGRPHNTYPYVESAWNRQTRHRYGNLTSANYYPTRGLYPSTYYPPYYD